MTQSNKTAIKNIIATIYPANTTQNISSNDLRIMIPMPNNAESFVEVS